MKIKKKLDKMNRRVAVTCITAIFLCMLYSVIFSFSGQDGETSGGVSARVTKAVVDVFAVVKGELNEEQKAQYICVLEPVIRKMAHFCEYMLMGILVYTLLAQWLSRRAGWAIFWVFLSASADEYYQTFVPGRDGNAKDVLLDTCGGAAGILLCVLLIKLYLSRKQKRNHVPVGDNGGSVK